MISLVDIHRGKTKAPTISHSQQLIITILATRSKLNPR